MSRILPPVTVVLHMSVLVEVVVDYEVLEAVGNVTRQQPDSACCPCLWLHDGCLLLLLLLLTLSQVSLDFGRV